MTGFEPRISGVKSNHFTKCATTVRPNKVDVLLLAIIPGPSLTCWNEAHVLMVQNLFSCKSASNNHNSVKPHFLQF